MADDLTLPQTEVARRKAAEVRAKSLEALRCGDLTGALHHSESEVALRRQLLRADGEAEGLGALAASLENLADVFDATGEPGMALQLHREALGAYRRLYPPNRFPDGHPDLARSLNDLGFRLNSMDRPAEARAAYQEAVDVYRRLHPAGGHPELPGALSNLGSALLALGEPDRAVKCCGEALAIRRRLYPAAVYTDGHPDLARCIQNAATVLRWAGGPATVVPLHR